MREGRELQAEELSGGHRSRVQREDRVPRRISSIGQRTEEEKKSPNFRRLAKFDHLIMNPFIL